MGLLATLALAVTLLPLLYGLQLAHGRVFTGSGVDTVDHGFYLSIMQQGAGGAWKTINLCTTGPTNRNFTHVFYVAAGHLGRLLQLEMPVAYHVARLLVGLLAILVLGAFLRRHLRADHAAVALVFVLFSAGVGWLPFGPGLGSVDLWLSEANSFMTLYMWPHLTWALLLRSVATVCVFHGSQRSSFGLGLLAGACCAFLAFDHPFDLVGIAITYASYTLLRWILARREGRAFDWRPWLIFFATTASVSLPFALLMFAQVRADPLLTHKANLSVEPLPSFLAVLSGYGLLVPLCLVPGLLAERSREPDARDSMVPSVIGRDLLLFLYTWAGASVAMMYGLASQFFARRLILGAHVPIAILAAVGVIVLLRRFAPGISRARKGACVAVVIALCAPTLAVDLFREALNYRRGTARNCRFYLTQEEVTKLRTLAASVPSDTMIQPVPTPLADALADPTTLFRAAYVPDFTLLVYAPWLTQRPLSVSHPWETPRFLPKLRNLMLWADAHGTEPIVRARGSYWTGE